MNEEPTERMREIMAENDRSRARDEQRKKDKESGMVELGWHLWELDLHDRTLHRYDNGKRLEKPLSELTPNQVADVMRQRDSWHSDQKSKSITKAVMWVIGGVIAFWIFCLLTGN